MKKRLHHLLLLSALGACAAVPASEPVARLEAWGTINAVLGEGRSSGRVRLEGVARPGTWGIGLLENLEGEVTILDGVPTLAVVEDGELVQRRLGKRDRATLLILASVDNWMELRLPEARTLGDLGYALSKAVAAAGFDGQTAPVPIRIEGTFPSISVNVIDHSSLTNPNGAQSLGWSGEQVIGSIVGIYAEGQAGVLTHEGQDFHLYAALRMKSGALVSGHLSQIVLGPDVRLFLPATSGHVSIRSN